MYWTEFNRPPHSHPFYSNSGWPKNPSGAWYQMRLNATVFVREHVIIPL